MLYRVHGYIVGDVPGTRLHSKVMYRVHGYIVGGVVPGTWLHNR